LNKDPNVISSTNEKDNIIYSLAEAKYQEFMMIK
jgi:hypothetical protein